MMRAAGHSNCVRSRTTLIVVVTLVVAATLQVIPKLPGTTVSIAGATGGTVTGTFAQLGNGELFGGGSTDEKCQNCQPGDPMGSSEAQSIQPGQPINPATGDFTTSYQVSSATDTLGAFGETLTYDADLGQLQRAAADLGEDELGFGWGWHDSLNSSFYDPSGYNAGTIQINQPNGAELTFTPDPTTSGNPDACPSGDYDNPLKYTIEDVPNFNNSGEWYCAANRVNAQLGYYSSTNSFDLSEDGGKRVTEYDMYGQAWKVTSAQDEQSGGPGIIQSYLYGITPGSTPSGTSAVCPTTVGIYAVSSCTGVTDGTSRAILQAWNDYGYVVGIVYPSAVGYLQDELAYDSTQDLTSIVNPDGTTTYGYNTAASYPSCMSGGAPCPYNTEMTSETNADGHATQIGWLQPSPATFSFTTLNTAVATSLTPPIGGATSYSYTLSGSTSCGQCLAGSHDQTTKVTYPDKEVDVDKYTGGLLTYWMSGTATAVSGGSCSLTSNCRAASISYTEPSASNVEWPHTGLSQQDYDTKISTTINVPYEAATEQQLVDQDAVGNVVEEKNEDSGGTLEPHFFYYRDGEDWAKCTSGVCTEASIVDTDNLNELCWTLPNSISPGSGALWCTNSETTGEATYYKYDVFPGGNVFFGDLNETVDPEGNTSMTQFNDAGLPCWSVTPADVAATGLTAGSAPGCSSPPSESTSYAYDQYGNVVTETNPDGATTTNFYDDFASTAIVASYSPPNAPSSGSGNPDPATVYSYSATDGRLSSKSVGDALTLSSWVQPPVTTNYVYDADGNRIRSWATSGAELTVSSSAYDADGRVCWSATEPSVSAFDVADECSSPPESATMYDYFVDTDSPDQVQDPSGNLTEYVYHDATNPTTVSETYVNTSQGTPGVRPTAPSTTAATTYVTGTAANQAEFSIDNVLGMECASGPVQTSCPDVSGNFTPPSGDTGYSFDWAGNATYVVGPTGEFSFYIFDDDVVPNSPTVAAIPEGVAPVSNTSPENTFTPTSSNTDLTYNVLGQLTNQVTYDGESQSALYNPDGQVCLIEPTSALSSGSVCPTSDVVVQNLETDEGSAGVTGEKGSYYDPAGELTADGDQSNSTINSYEPDGQLASAEQYTSGGSSPTPLNEVSYSYNALSEPGCVSYSLSAACTSTASTQATTCASSTPPVPTASTVNRCYDDFGNLTSTEDWLGNTVNYGYTSDGNYWLSGVSASIYTNSSGATGSLGINYSYEPNGRLQSADYTTSASGQPLFEQGNGYSYNAANQLSTGTIDGTTSSPGSGTITGGTAIAPTGGAVGYAQQGFAQQETNPSSSGGVSDTYTNQSNGSVESDTSPPNSSDPSTFAYSDATEELTETTPSSGNPTYYQYNSNGQRCGQFSASSAPTTNGCTSLPSNATSYAWNNYGQLTGVTPPSGSATSYTYDARGLRVSATTGSATSNFVWDTVDGGGTPEMLSDGAEDYVYGPLAFGESAPTEEINATTNAVQFLFSVPSGVQAVVSQGNSTTAGSLSELAQYTALGTQVLSSGSSEATPFGFQGMYQDAATGLDYTMDRYYDPTSAQFLSVDPDLSETQEPYALDNADSLNGSDPLGDVIRCESDSGCGQGAGAVEGPSGDIGCSENCNGAPGYTGSGDSVYTPPSWDGITETEWAGIGAYLAFQAAHKTLVADENAGGAFERAGVDEGIMETNGKRGTFARCTLALVSIIPCIQDNIDYKHRQFDDGPAGVVMPPPEGPTTVIKPPDKKEMVAGAAGGSIVGFIVRTFMNWMDSGGPAASAADD